MALITPKFAKKLTQMKTINDYFHSNLQDEVCTTLSQAGFHPLTHLNQETLHGRRSHLGFISKAEEVVHEQFPDLSIYNLTEQGVNEGGKEGRTTKKMEIPSIIVKVISSRYEYG